jgi:release factor glutamine methyltransferase
MAQPTATGQDLLEQLPGPLPARQIIALNQPKVDLHTHRGYEWNGWDFHERLLDGTIAVRGKFYAAMGVGLGVETVVAGLRGAREVYAVDVHPDSVRTARSHYDRLVGPREGTTFVPVVADVFDGFPDGVRLDVVTFNPPAVSQTVSDDPDIVRNVCVGTPLLEAFFEQLVGRDLLAPGGEVFVVASNTADLRGIVRAALEHGLHPEVHHLHEWDDAVRTYVFRLCREEAGA